jgi:hypothetical protein
MIGGELLGGLYDPRGGEQRHAGLTSGCHERDDVDALPERLSLDLLCPEGISDTVPSTLRQLFIHIPTRLHSQRKSK